LHVGWCNGVTEINGCKEQEQWRNLSEANPRSCLSGGFSVWRYLGVSLRFHKQTGVQPSKQHGVPGDDCRQSNRSAMNSRVSVKRTDPASPECGLLVQRLWEELGGLYGDTGTCRFTASDVTGAGAAFVVAWLDGQAVGCGALRPLESGVGEIKRMFVEPAARRQGIGRVILRALEEIARQLGYKMLRLETGVRQPAAIRLYENSGYKRIERYGPYANDPLSCCFEKSLK
jgi:putative acetyltransferase